MSRTPLRLLVVGAGKIGALADRPRSRLILSHAHAATRNRRTVLAGFVEPDAHARYVAVRRWGGEGFSSIADATKAGSYDIVIVSNPDRAHHETLLSLIKARPRLVVCEKPLAMSLAHARDAVARYRSAAIPLAVNYSRRYIPEFIRLRARIAEGRFGRFLFATAHYGKGLFHNGSHAVDTLRFLIGDLSHPSRGPAVADGGAGDPSYFASACAGGGHVTFHVVPASDYTHFELDLVFSCGRVRVLDGGVRIEMLFPAPDRVFSGHRRLKAGSHINTTLAEGPRHLLANAVAQLYVRAPLACTGEEALRTLVACEAIRQA